MNKLKRIVMGSSMGLAALIAGSVVYEVTPAHGTANVVDPASQGSSCQTTIEEEWAGTVQRYRVGARCDHIDRGTKVRGVQVITGGDDEYTDWFTDTATWHWTSWEYASWGIFSPDAGIEYGQLDKVAPEASFTFLDGSTSTTLPSGHDTAVRLVLPSDATGTMYFQVVQPDGTVVDLKGLPVGNGVTTYENTIAAEYLKPGHNRIKGYYSGDEVYTAFSPVLTVQVS